MRQLQPLNQRSEHRIHLEDAMCRTVNASGTLGLAFFRSLSQNRKAIGNKLRAAQ